uniref:Uncharacterized protein n=1 Tax=Panagrolaimus davidi TaxID=227884 RepID=A0A914Q0G9_9BILA
MVFQGDLSGITSKNKTNVDYLLAHPPELHPRLQPFMATFIDYYVKQWREKLEYINYYDIDGPRTTNPNECFHSSLNTVIPEKKMNFRICFTRFKQTLADAANDYMRSNYGEILKPREKQYVEAERLIIRRKRRMRALYDAGNHPGIDSLLRYSAVQAWRSTQPFEETRQDPRFVLQNVEPAPAPPPVIPEPIIAPIPPVVQPFVRMPFHQQQFNPHFNPYFQQQNYIQHIPQQFNMSLPVYYQQPPPQQFYDQQFPPYFYNPRF